MTRGMDERAQDALRKAVGSALDVLLAGMPATRIEESRSEVLGAVGRLHQRAGVPLPQWQCEARLASAAGTVRHDTIARRAQADKGAHKE